MKARRRAGDMKNAQAGHVPPALSACCLLNSMPRRLLHSDGALGSFARSIRTQKDRSWSQTASTSSDPSPMPPPCPEAYRESGDSWEVRARKRAVNSMVIALSFLHLREPHQAPAEILIGRRLSSRQWAVVTWLEKLLDAWIIHPLVTTESMGRNAAKVEELSLTLNNLEEFLVTMYPAGVYSKVTRENLKQGAEPADPPLRLGRSSLTSGSTFKKLDPDRIAFVGTPSFDPAPFLDRRGRDIFLHPLQNSLCPEDCLDPLPLVQVHIADGKRRKFLELLDSSGRLVLFKPHEVRPQFLSGIFAVGKDQRKDRLIMDARRPNVLEHPLERWIKSLASGEGLCRLLLLPGEAIYFSGNDVRDFYHLFAVSCERALRNGLCMSVPEVQCRKFAAYKHEEHADSQYLVPALNTLAMGDCQAVELAQTCHISLVWREGILEPASTLTLSGPPPRTSLFGGIVIDDFVCAQKVCAAPSIDKPSEGAQAADRLSLAHEREGLIPHPGKAFRDVPRATFWGTDIDGEAGLVRGSLQRAMPLLHVILRVLTVRAATSSLLQVIAGSLVSHFIYKSSLCSARSFWLCNIERQTTSFSSRPICKMSFCCAP